VECGKRSEEPIVKTQASVVTPGSIALAQQIQQQQNARQQQTTDTVARPTSAPVQNGHGGTKAGVSGAVGKEIQVTAAADTLGRVFLETR